MATSPNYNWPEPDNTDLVKNGALAIRTAVNAIDSSLAELKGGTTGQVLSKTSNTDMDFTWVAQDDSNAIQNAIVDAKGDLIGATAADTPARLAVGTNGQILTADSTASTGLAWATPAAGYTDNGVLNSAMNVWQRGTSVSVTSNTSTYTADRWNLFPNGATNAHTVSRQVTGDTTNLPDIQYCGRFQRNSGQTGTGNVFLCNSFESVNSIPFVGKQVTFSFYARRGANFSSASNALAFKVYTGTGTDQLSNTGYTGATAFISSTATLTTTWQRFTATATSSSSGTEVSVEFSHTPSGTAGANDYYEITGVQLEVSSSATAYHPNGSTYEEELAACQRYYFRAGGDNVYQYLAPGLASSSTETRFGFLPPVTMRIVPTSVDYSTLATYDVGAAQILTVTSLTIANASKAMTSLTANVSSGLTTYRPLFLITNNSTSGYVALNAEL